MKQHLQKFSLVILLTIVGIYTLLRLIYNGIEDDIQIISMLVLLWLCLAYLLLPHVYLKLSGIYLPDYFIGRTKTGDGMLGDPINIAFNGTQRQLIAAITAAGWHHADPLSLRSSIRITQASLFKKSYDTAPVSSLFLFGRKQDLAFEKQLEDNPRQRHHIRLWKTPKSWWLPGGYTADWVAAATFDRRVGVSLFTGQITHKITADIDTERDFVVASLQEVGAVKDLRVIEHYMTAFHTRNGGGDKIETDGAMPFITLKKR